MEDKKYQAELALLERLCNAFGPMGCEDEVASLIRGLLIDEKLCDRTYIDVNGNLFAWVSPDGKCDGSASDSAELLICAHMDEVGFMVTSVDDNGYLRFGAVGGIDDRVLASRRVIMGNELPGNESPNSRIKGVICSKPIHLMSAADRTTPTTIDKMYIDIGAKTREEAEKHIAPGDFGVFEPNFRVTYPDGMPHGRIVSKAIDDRVGCAVMLNVLRRMKAEGRRPSRSVCFAFTVGEEGGIAGAASATYRTRPEFALILESTAVGDIADTPDVDRVAPLGCGGALSIADRITIYDRTFTRDLMKLAEKNAIPCQYKRYISGGNDAAQVQRSHSGVRVAALSCPTRYLHTATTVAALDDYIAMTELVNAWISQ